MRARFITLLLASMLAGIAGAADLVSRYGVVSAKPSAGGNDAYVVALDGREIATVAAEDVSLYRVTQAGPDEFILVETWAPGLHCHHEFLLVTIHQDRSFKASPSFGVCSELQSASVAPGGVQVVLASPIPPHAPETFLWIGGKLSKH